MVTSAVLGSVNCHCFNQLNTSVLIYIPMKSKALEQFTFLLRQVAMRSVAEI